MLSQMYYFAFAWMAVLQYVLCDRLPPGVNPQRYNLANDGESLVQAVPQQGYQVPHRAQQVPHHAQVPQHGQHVPQHGQQVPHPSVPLHAQQHGGTHAPILDASNMQHEKEHMAEHFDMPIDTSKMSEQELQFHYFKINDADKNNKLDGCELIKSLIHWHEQGRHAATGGQEPPPPKIFSDEELIQLIDPILQMDDLNRDGYIDYSEFVRAQQKAVKQDKA